MQYLHKRTSDRDAQQVGFNGGVPISEEFFVQNISGKHNEELSRLLLPDWDLQRAMKFMDDKEALFRRYFQAKQVYFAIEWTLYYVYALHAP